MNTMKFTAVAYSDKGKIRTNNEDNFYFNGINLNAKNRDERNCYKENPTGTDLIYGVFDGMGGEALGEEASLIAAETTKKYHIEIQNNQIENSDSTIFRLVDEANAKICTKMKEIGECRIGTTFSLLSIVENKAKIYNIGDSRVYLFRKKKLEQLSIDDTMAQRMINMGILDKEQAKKHKDRHKLSQHLGIFKEEMLIEPHVSQTLKIQKGDKFILCSDGLTDMVDDEEIERIINKTDDCKKISQALVDKALENGGKDNVTVIVICANSNSKAKIQKKVYMIVLILAIVLLCVLFTLWFHKGIFKIF